MTRSLLLLLGGLACTGTDPNVGPFKPLDSHALELFPGCDAGAPVRGIPAAARDSIVALAADGPQTMHDRWASLAREVPGGFGGLWRAPDGVLEMGMVDPSQADAAKEALNAAGLNIPAEARPARVRASFDQLWDWRHYVGWSDAMISVGLSARRNRVVVGVTSIAARDQLAAALLARDVPCALFVLEVGTLPVT